jgi:hypothetical protein
VTQDSALTAALQAVLAAEDAAIFGYGVAGAYLAGTRQAAARACWDDHKSARDTVTAMLAARGARPAAAQAAYRLPFEVRTADRAVALAVYLEDGVTTAYLGVVAAGGPAARQFGALAMQQCAVRAVRWRGASVAFPGIPAAGPRSPQRPERSRSAPPAA